MRDCSGSGKCDTVKNARLEYAGVEKSGANRKELGCCMGSRTAIIQRDSLIFSISDENVWALGSSLSY